MKSVKSLFITWIVTMFILTFTCAIVYVIAQQSIRLSANELPSQLAVETSVSLDNGKSPNEVVSTEKFDVSKSLSTFVMVYDNNKKLAATSGLMGSNIPDYPVSVLDNVTQSNDSRVTWQPQKGLRFATVAIKYNNGYIVAARSLSEPEKLIDTIGRLVLAAYVLSSVFFALLLWIIKACFKNTVKNS